MKKLRQTKRLSWKSKSTYKVLVVFVKGLVTKMIICLVYRPDKVEFILLYPSSSFIKIKISKENLIPFISVFSYERIIIYVVSHSDQSGLLKNSDLQKFLSNFLAGYKIVIILFCTHHIPPLTTS